MGCGPRRAHHVRRIATRCVRRRGRRASAPGDAERIEHHGPRRHRLAQRLGRRSPVGRRTVRARGPVVGNGTAVVRGVARRTPRRLHAQRERLRSSLRRRCPNPRRDGDRARRPRSTHVGRRPSRCDPHRSAHAHPDRRVRHQQHDRRHVGAPGAGGRTRRRLGRRRTAGTGGDHGRPRRYARSTPGVTSPARAARCVGSTADPPTNGRSSSCRVSPSGGRRGGTCSCPIRAGPQDTAAPTSRPCAANGVGSMSTTRPRSWRRRTNVGGASRNAPC